MRKVLNLTAIILVFLSAYSCEVAAQEFIDELIIDFDGSPTEVISIITENDIDQPGVFGIRNGAFEITDVEGRACGDAAMTGMNDNFAVVVGGVATKAYCGVIIDIEASFQGDLEDCLSPGTPIGCTTIGVSEPGGDGVSISVMIGGNEVLVGGYCGDMPVGSFRVTGLDIEVSDVIQVNITGGTQAPDESYFIERILVRGTERSLVPSQIMGDEDYCDGSSAIVLNAFPTGGSDHRWFLDGEPLPNDNNPIFTSVPPAISDEGLYRVEFNEPGGCPTSAELKINVTDCASIAANFSIPTTFCSSESLSLPTNSISGLTGEWNVDPNLDLEDQVGTLDIVFTPDNGGIPFMQTIEVFQSYCDTLSFVLCPRETVEVNNICLLYTSPSPRD